MVFKTHSSASSECKGFGKASLARGAQEHADTGVKESLTFEPERAAEEALARGGGIHGPDHLLMFWGESLGVSVQRAQDGVEKRHEKGDR